MAEINGAAAEAAVPAEGGEKTFTQAEVNAMIGKRVNEVTAKFADYDALKAKAEQFDKLGDGKSELQKANERADALQKELDGIRKDNKTRGTREKVAKETGVPIDLLTGEDEESCKKQAEAILAFAKPAGYPGAKPNKGSTQPMTQTDAEMAAWANQIFGGR